MAVKEAFALAATIVILAGFSVAIIHGDNTAKVFEGLANGFANTIKAATGQATG